MRLSNGRGAGGTSRLQITPHRRESWVGHLIPCTLPQQQCSEAVSPACLLKPYGPARWHVASVAVTSMSFTTTMQGNHSKDSCLTTLTAISMTPDDQAHLVAPGSTCLLVHKRLQWLATTFLKIPNYSRATSTCTPRDERMSASKTAQCR